MAVGSGGGCWGIGCLEDGVGVAAASPALYSCSGLWNSVSLFLHSLLISSL